MKNISGGRARGGGVKRPYAGASGLGPSNLIVEQFFLIMPMRQFSVLRRGCRPQAPVAEGGPGGLSDGGYSRSLNMHLILGNPTISHRLREYTGVRGRRAASSPPENGSSLGPRKLFERQPSDCIDNPRFRVYIHNGNEKSLSGVIGKVDVNSYKFDRFCRIWHP